MIKQGIILGICMLMGFFAQAQNEVEIQIGDTLYFGACEGESFEYIDLYVKTRFEDSTEVDFNKLIEWDFYNTFFETGDFDIRRLPCSYSGKYGIIKHMMGVVDEDENYHTVVIVMIESGKSVGYIIEQAFDAEELIFAPKQ